MANHALHTAEVIAPVTVPQIKTRHLIGLAVTALAAVAIVATAIPLAGPSAGTAAPVDAYGARLEVFATSGSASRPPDTWRGSPLLATT
jgi:hypothetical protein